MAFIDNLAFSLFAISMAGFILLYAISSMYFVYKRKRKDFSEYLDSASIPLAILGAFLFITGLWGQFTWPLPGSYNILFYDPLVAFSILLISFSLAIRLNAKLEYAGFLSLMIGLIVIAYGIEGYGIGLTKEPIALLAMYFFYGAAGILGYPVSLIVDRLPGLQKNVWMGWEILLILFWLALFAASVLAGVVGAAAIPAHLLTPP